MTTALECITGAAKLIGVLFKSEGLDADEASDGLVALNDMLDGWSNDDSINYFNVLENFALTGAASYTIGSGGNFNTTRPISIISAVIRSGSSDYPLQLISEAEYQLSLPVKSISSSIPQFIVYDSDYPLGVIKLYPVGIGSTLYLQSRKPLGTYSALTDTVSLPAGFIEAIKYNLALRLVPLFGVEPSDFVVDTARKSLGSIRRAGRVNEPLSYMGNVSLEPNIYTGYFV